MIELDTWVFDHVEQLFIDAKSDPALEADLRGGKFVLFLHLLGIDTFGHAKRPYSAEYTDEITVVDKGIARIVTLVDEFYNNDGQTAYVFTAGTLFECFVVTVICHIYLQIFIIIYNIYQYYHYYLLLFLSFEMLDHGMSDKGSHGDGETANTETPLIVWGAGVKHTKANFKHAPKQQKW